MVFGVQKQRKSSAFEPQGFRPELCRLGLGLQYRARSSIGKSSTLDFIEPLPKLERQDNRELRAKILALTRSEAERLRIGKSTLHYLHQRARTQRPLRLSCKVGNRLRQYQMCANLMTSPEIFLSYNHKDGKLARKVKYELKKLGFAAFLAHKDISVSAEWRAEILKHLDNCSALMAIVTKSFAESAWTNQEVGIALGREKPIVSLMFNGSKLVPGFLEALQGIAASENAIDDAVRRGVRVVSRDASFNLSQLARRTKPLAKEDEYVQFSDKARHLKDDTIGLLKELQFNHLRNTTIDVSVPYGGGRSQSVVSALRKIEITELGFARTFRFLADFLNEWPTAYNYPYRIGWKHNSQEYGNARYNNIWIEVSYGKFHPSSLHSRFSGHPRGFTMIPISSNLMYLGTDRTMFQFNTINQRTISKLRHFASIIGDDSLSNHSKLERIEVTRSNLRAQSEESRKAVEDEFRILKEKLGWSGGLFTMTGELRPGFVISNIRAKDSIKRNIALMLNWIAENGHWM
jgi:hypothetical protein